MKISTVIFSASVVLNLALLGTVAVGLAVNDSPSGSTAPLRGAPAARPPLPTGPGQGTWAGLRAEDITAERDRLRREGFPENLVRAIIAAQIREKYAAQRKALEPDSNAPFWKPRQPDPKLNAALRELSQAERKEIKNVLGADPDNSSAELFRRQIPGLSADKAEELDAIRQRYNEKRQELFTGGPLSPADRETFQSLDKAMHDEFVAVLTPQELEQYDLRASQTAMQLQYMLAAFDPTEAEFMALYKVQSAFNDQFSPQFGNLSQDQMKARMQAQKQLNDDIAAALGPERYAQYQKATDYNYRTATQLVARLDLPPETADNLYAVQKEYQQKQQDLFKTMRGAQGFDDVRQQLTALQQEATTRVSAVLNGNTAALDAYKTYGGQWLRNLVPAERGPGTVTSRTIIGP